MPNNGAPAGSIVVSGAGTTGANGTYLWDDFGYWWKGEYTIFFVGNGVNVGTWVLNLYADSLYIADQTWPAPANPPKTGWGIATGVGPAPTLSYIA